MLQKFCLKVVFLCLLLCHFSVFSQSDMGVDEKLGNVIDMNLIFLDENGEETALKEIIDKPTILNLVYYRCPGICSPLMNGLVEVLDRVDMKEAVDYQVLTISFDPTETPDLGKNKKVNYLKAFSRPFSPDGWHFMAGSAESINSLTDQVGFRYKKQGKDFLHPGVIIMLSPEGKIVRYFHGLTFLPFDIKLALLEAKKGKTGPTINKILLYCFSYDPEGKTYVFNILRVSATVILTLASLFIIFLIIMSKKKNKEK